MILHQDIYRLNLTAIDEGKITTTHKYSIQIDTDDVSINIED